MVNFCEIDKYASKAYCSIHEVDESLNLGDITKVDENKIADFNMICGGSPCQDFSVAGKKKGSTWTCNKCKDINGDPFEWNPLTVHYTQRHKCPHCGSENMDKSRSSLLVEYLRIIKRNKPNFGIYENVKNIVGKFKETFKLFTDELEEYGYSLYWKVLNSKDYGLPQNRERVYLIFIRNDLDNGKFKFPEPFYNGIALKDILKPDVDEKYYLPENKVLKFLTDLNSEDSLHAFQVKRRNQSVRIRKLIPMECFRLMGFCDDDFFKAMIGNAKLAKEFISQHPCLTEKTVLDDATALQGISNSQLYTMSGNSIVVPVLYCIFFELYKAMPYLFEDLKLSSYFSGIGAFEAALDKLYENITKYEARNIKEYIFNVKGYTHTKDNYIAIGAAMRGRYTKNGRTEQRIEIRNDNISNTITTVQKDSLVVIKRNA